MQNEKTIITDDFIVDLITEGLYIEFKVYPIDQNGDKYIVKGKDMEFEGTFRWRGVWEGRLYFVNKEIFAEDLEYFSILYNDNIAPWCKEFIKNKDPHNYYDE